MADIQCVYKAIFRAYRMGKVWRQFARGGIIVARCTVARLMRTVDLAGVVRGRRARTTIPDPAGACPPDRVDRQFQAACPNRLWVADFTYVAIWSGFVCAAFAIDVFARGIVGWRVALSPSRLRARCSGASLAQTPPLRRQRPRLTL